MINNSVVEKVISENRKTKELVNQMIFEENCASEILPLSSNIKRALKYGEFSKIRNSVNQFK